MKILIAVDTTEANHQATVAARDLFPDAEHLLLSAASLTPYVIPEPLGGGAFMVAQSLDTMEMAEHQADEAVKVARDVVGSTSEALIGFGEPGHVICEQAVAHHVDVIVVGHRSKSWVSRLFDPSVSDYVVRHAPCPVLVVREQD